MPLRGSAHEEVGLQSDPGGRLLLEQALHGGRLLAAPEHRVAALEQGPGVGEAKARQEVAQVGHGHRIVSGEIDGAEEGDVGRHCGGCFSSSARAWRT